MIHRPALALGILSGLAALPALSSPTAAQPSFGCGLPPPLIAPTAVPFDGGAREVIVSVPDDYTPDRTYPLVIGFHGRTNDNAQVRRYYGLEDAARFDAIFVYPLGERDETGRFNWADSGDTAGSLRDYALFDRILADVGARYCIDQDAVFVVGHSLGASFANSLACARADRIRGVATVAGGISPSPCSGEVAALLLHNPADEAVPVEEGERARDVFLEHSVGEEAKPEPETVAGFECERHGEDNPVLWCLHRQDFNRRGNYYPHLWPNEAGAAIMDFFAELED